MAPMDSEGPGREVERPSSPGLRASDQDRDAAVELLSQAAGDGRLTLDEYSVRADQALAARLIDELSELTGDLQRPAGSAALPAAQGATEVQQLSAILGNETRKGHWQVPARIEARSLLGDCHLELQDAVLTSHVTVIEARATLGSVTIFVPDGVEVRLSGKAILGTKSSKLNHAPLPGAPVIEVQATAVLGSVTVQPPSLSSRVRGALADQARRRLGPPAD
jgi:hypothetical protein